MKTRFYNKGNATAKKSLYFIGRHIAMITRRGLTLPVTRKIFIGFSVGHCIYAIKEILSRPSTDPYVVHPMLCHDGRVIEVSTVKDDLLPKLGR